MKDRWQGELVFDEGLRENELIREDASARGLLGHC
jgi:hypothetical protein